MQIKIPPKIRNYHCDKNYKIPLDDFKLKISNSKFHLFFDINLILDSRSIQMEH